MGVKITAAEHEALPESLKAKFTAEGDSFTLVEEDVEGLKKSKAEILAEKKRIQDERDELAKFKKESDEAERKAAEELLIKQGEFEKAQVARDAEWQKRLEAATADREALFSDVHRERLTNEIVKRGGLPDRADYLVSELLAETELFRRSDSGQYDLRKKGGIGDAAEFDGIMTAKKESKPFFFAASGASGSGASGSGNNQGGSGKAAVTRAQYDANPGAYAAQLAKGELSVTD